MTVAHSNKTTLTVNDAKIDLESITSKTNDNIEDTDLNAIPESTNPVISHEEGGKNKFKDYELYKLRKIIEETQAQIANLTMNNAAYKKTIPDYEDIMLKASKMDYDLEDVKISCKKQVKKMQGLLQEKESEITSKDSEIEDLTELIKRSEEKRTYSNEYNAFMENSNSKLKDKYASIIEDSARVEKELEEVRKIIREKEARVEELKVNFAEVQAELDREKQKNASLATNYETIKEGIKSNNEKTEMLRLKYKVEKEKVQKFAEAEKKNSEKSKVLRNPIKKRMTIAEQAPLNVISKDEAQRWKQRYTDLESELIESKESLEKLYRSEIYLKNQLLTKDLMVSQIESIMKQGEESEESSPQTSPRSNSQIDAKSLAELITLMEEMKYRYKNCEDALKCASCFKIPSECYLASPCGHLSCLNCKGDFEEICPQCSKNINTLVHAVYLDRVIYNYRKEVANVDRAKKLLEI